jgi:PRTRC genetic system protein B
MAKQEHDTDFKLDMMLAIYTRGQDFDGNDDRYYIESHKVLLDRDGKPMLLEGKALTMEALRELRTLLHSAKTKEKIMLKGQTPARLLYADQSKAHPHLIWHVPAHDHKLNFVKEAKPKNGLMHCPDLVLEARDNELFVYALRGGPDRAPQLFHAPFMNVYQDAKVCMGDARREARLCRSFATYMQAWEDSFFNSRFSHGVHDHACVVSGNVEKLTAQLISAYRKFPLEELKPFKNKKLKDLWS